MKNSMTQAAAIRTKAGYCIASVSLLGPRPLRSQHLEHLIECARDFADSYQRYIHGGKQGRVIRDRSGETFSGQKCRPQFTDHRTKPADIRVAREQFEGVVQTRTRLQKQRQIPGEGRHFRRTRPAEKTETGARCGNGCLVLDGFDRQQPKILDTVRHFRRRRSR
jgi:hypothetical protein